MNDAVASRMIIIGGGPAGYTAALYGARARLEPICIEGYAAGGQIARSGQIDNFPGFPGGIAGADLGERIRTQAMDFGAVMRTEEVESVDLTGPTFRVATADHEYEAESVIVATGAQPRRLDMPSEDEYEGRGVCYCAICDGPFFAGQRVVVVGGGDAAVEEAIALSNIASSVVLVHRRREFRASATSLAALGSTAKIRVHTPAVVSEILGEELGVTGVRVRDLDTGTESVLPADGVFVAIGHDPANGLFTKWLDIDDYGYLRATAGSTATRIPGVFVAGDIADPRYRQAITASASGCAAAIDAERWLVGRRGAQAMAARGAMVDVDARNTGLGAEQLSTDEEKAAQASA